MATAQREGGLYYVNGKAVDAEGKAIEGAPKQKPDTDPSQQPGGLVATGLVSADPIQRLADTLVTALSGSKGAKAKPASDGEGEEESDELPTVDELDEHLAGITSLDEVKAMKRRDKRVTAAPKYEARIAELKGE